MAGRYTIPIEVDLPSGRFTDDAELTAYYVIAESITDAIRYARARRIRVHGEKSGGWLRVTVSDDGRGGQAPARWPGRPSATERYPRPGRPPPR